MSNNQSVAAILVSISLTLATPVWAAPSCPKAILEGSHPQQNKFETVASMQKKGVLPEIAPGQVNDFLRERQETFIQAWNARLIEQDDLQANTNRQINSNFPIDRSFSEVVKNLDNLTFRFPEISNWQKPPYPFIRHSSSAGLFKIDTLAVLKSWSGNHVLDLGAGNFLTALTLLEAIPYPEGSYKKSIAPILDEVRAYYRSNGFPRVSGFSLVDMKRHQSEPKHILELGRDEVFVDSNLVENTEGLNPVIGDFFEAVEPRAIIGMFGLSSGGYDSEGILRYTGNPQAVLKNLAALLEPGAIIIGTTSLPRSVRLPDGSQMGFYDFVNKYGKGFEVYHQMGGATVIVRTQDEFYLPHLVLAANGTMKTSAPSFILSSSAND
jgi:hypothetical protein